MQGYIKQTDAELSELAFGNRFAYRLCTTIVIIGVVSSSIPVLSAMLIVAFFGIILPYHPFDYIYNHLLAERMSKPKLPRRSKQLKFACTIATIWIASTIFLFYTGYALAAFVVGSLLIGVALLVSTTDYCIPSLIYNTLSPQKDNVVKEKSA